jgi:hypothetical protein
VSSEQVKTATWIVAAVVLGLSAYLNLPRNMEMESQDKVNTPLFTEYQPSSVWEIQIQQPPSAAFKLRDKNASSVEQLTVKRQANRGWELVEFEAYPAENAARLGLLAALLDDLKVLEVVSESATDGELAEYGLLPPDATEGSDSQKGTRIKLSTSGQVVVGDLVVGKSIPATEQATATAYVRPAAEKVIYRVALEKAELTTALVDWINPNVLGIKGPPNMQTFGPTFRTVEKIEVGTPKTGRSDGDAYRAEFKFGELVELDKLYGFENSQWTPVTKQRLPSSVEFTQAWRSGLDVVPALLVPIYVKRKQPELQAIFRSTGVDANTNLGELAGMGFAVEDFPDGPRVIGETGLMSVTTKGGVRFHFSVGRPGADETVPVLIYADLISDSGLSQPVLGQLPAEASDWPDDRKAAETEKLQREFAKQTEDWKLFNQQRGQDLANLNERLAPWVFYMPMEYVVKAIPSFRLGESAEIPVETTTEATVPSATTATDPAGTKSDE